MTSSSISVIKSLQYHWAANYCKGQKVMYIGCGRGEVCNILAEHADFVLGVDSSHANIELALKSTMPANVEFKVIVDGVLPFEEASFDVIILPNQIELAYDPKEFLKKINRVLKPDGKLIISTVNRLLRLYFWQKPYVEKHYQEYSPYSFKKLLSEYFKDVDLMGIHIVGSDSGDNQGGVQAHKFKHGIMHPLSRFILKKIRTSLRFILPFGFFNNANSNAAVPLVKVEVDSFTNSSLQETLEKLLFVKDNIERCTDMLAICCKSDSNAK